MELFYSKLDEHILSLAEKFRSKFVITQAAYDEIMLVLKDGRDETQFKFWIRKHFKLVIIGELQIVYGITSNNPVVTYEPQTFIQAFKDYVNVGLAPMVEACSCNSNCATKKCSCKAAKIQCGTKCHPVKKNVAQIYRS